MDFKMEKEREEDPFHALLHAALGKDYFEDVYDDDIAQSPSKMNLAERTQRALKLNLQQVQLLKYQQNKVESELCYITEIARKTKQLMIDFRKEKEEEVVTPRSDKHVLWPEGDGGKKTTGRVLLPVCRSLGYLVGPRGEIPAYQPDLLLNQQWGDSFEKLKEALKRRRWTVTEKLNLKKGVRQQNQQLLLMPFLKTYQQLHVNEHPKEDVDHALAMLRENMAIIGEMDDQELEMNVDGIDWERLASIYLPHRRAMECYIRYVNVDHPGIEHVVWTQQEDTILRELASKYHERHWVRIATELGVRYMILPT
jgi:hypothetical protein